MNNYLTFQKSPLTRPSPLWGEGEIPKEAAISQRISKFRCHFQKPRSAMLRLMLAVAFLSASMPAFAGEKTTSVPVHTDAQNLPSKARVTAPSEDTAQDPLQEMDLMLQKMQQMIQSNLPRQLWETWTGGGPLARDILFDPDLDLSETVSHYIIKVDLPGMKKSEIQLESTEHVLILSGERKIEKEERKEGGIYRKERAFGSFRRSVSFPEAVKVDQITAEYADGVLTVRVPKVVPDDVVKKVKVEVR